MAYKHFRSWTLRTQTFWH